MGIFKRQKPVQSGKENCVVENPNANPVMIKQLSTRFTDRRGNDTWSYLVEHKIAAFEVIKSLAPDANPLSCFSGLVRMNDIYRVAVDLDIRFRDESGDSAGQYLLSHLVLALELFKPTKIYENVMWIRSDPERAQAALMQAIRRREKPAPA